MLQYHYSVERTLQFKSIRIVLILLAVQILCEQDYSREELDVWE